MKKLLLSSIIMFGVCGYVTAQSATESKVKRNTSKSTTTPSATNAATATPQKAAIMDEEKVVTAKTVAPSDVDATPNAVKPVGKNNAAKTTKTENAAGEVIDADVAKKKEIEAAKAKKVKDN